MVRTPLYHCSDLDAPLAADQGDAAAERRNKKRRERLSADLRTFFRIDGEPIVATADGKGWRSVFGVKSDDTG